MPVCVYVYVCVRVRSLAELMIYVDSPQTLVLAGVGMDGAAPSAPTFVPALPKVSVQPLWYRG